MVQCANTFSMLFILTGVANVLIIKWMDNQEAECTDGKVRRFQHPVLQTWCMFAGEFLCFVVYRVLRFFLRRRQNDSENYNILTMGLNEFSPLSFLLPAFLDTIASVMLFMGLYLTYTSSFILIRMAVTIFVGIFGSIAMNERLICRHSMAIFTIFCGIIVVICMDIQRVLYDTQTLPHTDANSVLTGDLLILTSQIFQGAQYVYEEKHLKTNDIAPMQAIGWQGIFGLIITSFLVIIMNFMPSVHPFSEDSVDVVDDFNNAMHQIASNSSILLLIIAFILLVAVYNFTRAFFQKHTSAASLVLNEPIKIIFTWMAILVLTWEYFHLIVFGGFVILMMGFTTYRTANSLEFYRSIIARLRNSRYSYFSSNEPSNDIPPSRPADVV